MEALRSQQGFTLVEVLTALVIFSLLVPMVFGAFRTISSSTELLGRGRADEEMGQVCLARMAADLESVYVAVAPTYQPPEMADPPDPYRFTASEQYLSGEAYTQLRFTSWEHLPFGADRRQGVAEIVYYPSAGENDTVVLRRSDRLFPYPDFEERESDPVLCKNVRKFSVGFSGAEDREEDTWDSDAETFGYATPRSVTLTLHVGTAESFRVLRTRVHLPVYREERE